MPITGGWLTSRERQSLVSDHTENDKAMASLLYYLG